MKVYNDAFAPMTANIKEKISEIRKRKDFSASHYIVNKAQRLNKYMEKCGLDACVVAVSGGIDSAITLGIVKAASKFSRSPIKKIIPVMLPALENTGVTGQDEARDRGIELCRSVELDGHIMNIAHAVQVIRYTVEKELNSKTDDWAIGQLCPYTRTPFLYYITSLCSVEGLKAILVGTTNRDEGAYLGYIGKASDGMVDVQLISDLHKSEVYEVAEALEIPRSIIEVTPTGDMYDNRCDTEVFGAPYDFVELYLNYLNMDKYERDNFYNSLDGESQEQFKKLSNNLDNLHKYNRHKYISHSPAVHLDLWDCSCPDGWINYYEISKWFLEE